MPTIEGKKKRKKKKKKKKTINKEITKLITILKITYNNNSKNITKSYIYNNNVNLT